MKLKRFARSLVAILRLNEPRLLCVVMAVITGLLFMVFTTVGSERSFLVEAKTGQISLRFDGDSNAWRLPNATLCRPVDIPRLTADDACGAAFIPVGEAQERLIAWSNDVEAIVWASSDGGLAIEIQSDIPPDVITGSKLLVPATDWENLGALTFQATVALGEDMATGAQHYLRGGRWEAREAGWSTSLLRPATEVVKSGTFSVGAVVTVVNKDLPAEVYGHITPGGFDGSLEVTMLSKFGDTRLAVRHFGLDGPVLIRPDWVDVALSSPLLLVIAGIFSVLAAASQIIADTNKGRSNKHAPRADGSQ